MPTCKNTVKVLLKVILKLLKLAHFWAHEHTSSWVTAWGEKAVFLEFFRAREECPKHLIFPCLPSNPSIFLTDLYIYIWLLSRELFLSHLHHIFSSDINMNWGYGPVWSSQENVEITSMWPIKAILNTHWWFIIASYFPSWCRIYSIYWRGKKVSRKALPVHCINKKGQRKGWAWQVGRGVSIYTTPLDESKSSSCKAWRPKGKL